MKTMILVTLLAFSAFATPGKYKYQLEITNLTTGQGASPFVIALGDKSFKLVQVGKMASKGLAYQAKDGVAKDLVKELNSNKYVSKVFVTSGLLAPGKSTKITFHAKPNEKVSLSSMLVKTNDAIVAGNRIALPKALHMKSKRFLKVYDAGAELNNESKDYIPALGSHGVDTDTNEGFISFHPGVSGVADLNPITDSFGVIAAKVVIKRIK